jgi:hypothetical protein
MMCGGSVACGATVPIIAVPEELVVAGTLVAQLEISMTAAMLRRG